jgi:hypothetical protein
LARFGSAFLSEQGTAMVAGSVAAAGLWLVFRSWPGKSH